MGEAEKAEPTAKGRETRERVFRAAAELFEERGYQAATIDEIARRAQVAKSTFFFHFPTKDAIVTELVGIQLRAARRARERVRESGGDALAMVRATVLMLGEAAGA